MACQIHAVLFLFAPLAWAFRLSRNGAQNASSPDRSSLASQKAGIVFELYTFGTPKVSIPGLRNPASADGCFNGARFINIHKRKGWVTSVDFAPPSLTGGWGHVLMPVMKVDQNADVEEHACGWKGSDFEWPSFGLHDGSLYANQATKFAKLTTVVEVGLRQSYNHDKEEVAKIVGGLGWSLVGTARVASPLQGFVTRTVSHLMQEPITLDCILTFEGSSSPGDWVRNLYIGPVPFCGLPYDFHKGFTEALREIVTTTAFQQSIRGNLGKCRKVSVTGHSLGGAMGAMLAACVGSGGDVEARMEESDMARRADFDLVSWVQEEPALIQAA